MESCMKIAKNRSLWPTIEEKTIPLKEAEESNGNYPSQLEKLITCMRRAYWDKTDPIEEDFSHLHMTFAHGDAIHVMLVDMFKKAGVWRGDEVRGSNAKYRISYRIDALIADPTNEDAIVPVELKSIKARSWELIKDEPFFGHYIQLQLYLHYHKPMPYPYGYILYYNKNEDITRTYTVFYDEDLCKKIESAIGELDSMINIGDLPVANISDDNCKWCQYKDRCYDGVDVDD